jgi:hypothetical protein
MPTLSPELLLDTYFTRIHGKPYYILDEATTRQRLQANQLPGHLAYAIYAVSTRYNAQPLILMAAINRTSPDMHPSSEATLRLSRSARSMRAAPG